jgi:hypothetical protein
MNKKLLVLISAASFVFVIVFIRCTSSSDKGISEGTIEYSASVVDKTSFAATMAPSKMTIQFKNNVSCVEMSAAMGMFATAFVSNPQNRTLTQMVKLLNKKYWLTEGAKDIEKDNNDYNFNIRETADTKMIAGLKCKRAIVHHKSGDTPDFDIYYTNELEIKDPNFANPFNKIDGVLMEYQIKKFGLEMKFVATSVTKESVNEKIFEVPADYKKISKKEMNDLFLGLQ